MRSSFCFSVNRGDLLAALVTLAILLARRLDLRACRNAHNDQCAAVMERWPCKAGDHGLREGDD